MAKRQSTRSTITGFTYSIPAIKAIQAGQTYFTTALPFAVLVKLLKSSSYSEEVVPFDRDRSKAIAQYVLQHRESYVLPAITVSVSGKCDFRSQYDSSSGVAAGTLRLPINAGFRVHDGIYRAHGIAEALAANPRLGDETLSVVIYPSDTNNGQAERRFSDIKANQRKSGRAERIISDPADPIANITRAVIANVPAFTNSIEMVKTTISNRSRNLFTFSALYQANEILLAAQDDQSLNDRGKLAITFWLAVQDAMPDWTSDTSRFELRKRTIHAHGVTLCAIATVGNSLTSRFQKSWARKLIKLNAIDWSRANTNQWEGNVMLGGKIIKSAASIELTASVIAAHIGVDLRQAMA